MKKEEERDYRDVCCEMTDQLLALASRVAGQAVGRKISYKLACHAIKVALYQGLFGATLRQMKNDGLVPQSLKMEDAFVSGKHHEAVAHEMLRLVIDHLQVADPGHTWSVNILKRERAKIH